MIARGNLAAIVVGLALGSVPSLGANAAPISATVNQTLSNTPVTISFDGMMVASLFAASTAYGPGASVSTIGTGQITTVSGMVTDFNSGASIDQTGELYTFAAYPSAAIIPFSATDDFIGLLATLNDGVHYGYAEVAGPDLLSVGFETAPGTSILTGETGSGDGITVTTQATPVPEPASIALFVTSLALLTARRRARSARPRASRPEPS